MLPSTLVVLFSSLQYQGLALSRNTCATYTVAMGTHIMATKGLIAYLLALFCADRWEGSRCHHSLLSVPAKFVISPLAAGSVSPSGTCEASPGVLNPPLAPTMQGRCEEGPKEGCGQFSVLKGLENPLFEKFFSPQRTEG